MARKSFTHGTPAQFEAMLENKISDLKGEDSKDSVTSAVNTSDDIDIDEYVERLGLETVGFLEAQGFEAYSSIEDGYLEIQVEGVSDIFVQPIDEIEPNWDDLNMDASTLADDVMEELSL